MKQKGRKKRCWEHDYCAPAFYMITISTSPRRDCLSAVCLETGAASSAEPRAKLSPLGEIVRAAWVRNSEVYPKIEAYEYVIMPDHFHGVLRVKKRLNRHVGHVIKAFKRVVEKEARAHGFLRSPSGSASASAPAVEHDTLWEEGYYDTILLQRGQLQNMVAYIEKNPRRYALKQANPDLFTVVADLAVTQQCSMPALGNRFLLDRPVKRQVQISRKVTEEALAAQKDELLYAASHGAVLVSPCISPGEKEVAHAALDAGLPLIALVDDGFKPRYKPPGKYFDACADGRLLMLAPFPHHCQKRKITRDQCLMLNDLAETICEDA
jgi:hypothetical protein